MNTLNLLAHYVADGAHNYNKFDDLNQVGNTMGQYVSSIIALIQRYIWIPIALVGILAIISWLGGRAGKAWAGGKLRDIVIVAGGVLFFVYILTAFMNAFSANGTDVDNMTNSLHGHSGTGNIGAGVLNSIRALM